MNRLALPPLPPGFTLLGQGDDREVGVDGFAAGRGYRPRRNPIDGAAVHGFPVRGDAAGLDPRAPSPDRQAARLLELFENRNGSPIGHEGRHRLPADSSAAPASNVADATLPPLPQGFTLARRDMPSPSDRAPEAGLAEASAATAGSPPPPSDSRGGEGAIGLEPPRAPEADIIAYLADHGLTPDRIAGRGSAKPWGGAGAGDPREFDPGMRGGISADGKLDPALLLFGEAFGGDDARLIPALMQGRVRRPVGGGVAARLGARREINQWGYRPAPGDEMTLARMMFAESAEIPGDFEAIGWSIVNRVGHPHFAATLNGLLRQRNQFPFMFEGGGPRGNHPNWNRTATPQRLRGTEAKRWVRAWEVAKRILGGVTSDPTGGATFFFASPSYDGAPETAPGGFESMLRRRTIRPSPYRSTATGQNRWYFFIETNPPPKPRRRQAMEVRRTIRSRRAMAAPAVSDTAVAGPRIPAGRLDFSDWS